MENLGKGSIKFDPLLVMGRDFIPPVWQQDTGFYDYAFGVNAYVADDQPKKKQDLVYVYNWTGHINICLGSARIHLHNPENDVGLVGQEEKMLKIKGALELFLKEHKARLKTPGKKDLNVREWLNNGEGTHYTGYLMYQLRKDGGGMFGVADCHKTLHWWIDVWRDEKGKLQVDDSREKTLKQMDTLAKGLGKAIAAIQQLRKFFEREMESDGK